MKVVKLESRDVERRVRKSSNQSSCSISNRLESKNTKFSETNQESITVIDARVKEIRDNKSKDVRANRTSDPLHVEIQEDWQYVQKRLAGYAGPRKGLEHCIEKQKRDISLQEGSIRHEKLLLNAEPNLLHYQACSVVKLRYYLLDRNNLLCSRLYSRLI